MKDFLQLIRAKNLVLLAFIQCVSAYCLSELHIKTLLLFYPFWALVFSTALVAAGGYVINDYLDIKADLVNKPGKVLIGKRYSRRGAIFTHIFLNVTALILISPIYPKLGLLELVIALMLIKYSSTYKRMPLIGNVMVAFFCGISILVVSFLPLQQLDKPFLIVFSFFAFWATLIREIVKDMQDILGDRMMKCRTLPIVWGLKKSRNLSAILLLLLAVAHPFSLFILGHHESWVMLYSLLFIALPCLLVSRKLILATQTTQFAQISTQLKWLMLFATIGLFLIRFTISNEPTYTACF